MTQQYPGGPRQGLNLEQAFERASTLHHRNRLNEADAMYRAILEVDPDHLGALHHLGVLANQNGNPYEAERLLRRAVLRHHHALDVRNHLGMVLQGLGRHEQALAEYRDVIAIDPGHFGARSNLGNALHFLGRSDEAIAHLEWAATAHPALADTHNNLGNALRVANRIPEAIAHFRKALELQPDFAEAHNNLGVALAESGAHDPAIVEYEQAIAKRPRYFEAHNNLANTLTALGRYDEAIAQFENSLRINPDAAGTHNNFGNLLTRQKQYAEAIVRYRKAIELNPEFVEAHNNLGNALAASSSTDAIEHFRKALALHPRYADALTNLGNVYGGLERYEDAIGCYRQALAIAPEQADVYFCLGNALITIGRIDEGRDALETAIALSPNQPDFYRSLGECKRFTIDDPHLAAMEALARDMTALTEDQRVVLHFVLGKAYDDTQQHDAAARHIDQANRLQRPRVDYDEQATLDIHRRVIDIFTPELMRQKASGGDPSPVPIFILGMPRSGTTLIEQVLASHPAVFGAGEIVAFYNAVHDQTNLDGAQPFTFPDSVLTMSGEHLRLIGQHYVKRVSQMAPAAIRITDKALGNFAYAGLIRLALPNARIIHARRDPIDTCLSCYSKLFASELLYTYDLRELGRFYRSYEDIMAHWRTVLPEGAMLEIQYEEMISDFENQARKIVDHCGLTWDDRCLNFHKTDRPVRTASATQVRKPIYPTSVGRWQPYQAMLQPLIDELKR